MCISYIRRFLNSERQDANIVFQYKVEILDGRNTRRAVFHKKINSQYIFIAVLLPISLKRLESFLRAT